MKKISYIIVVSVISLHIFSAIYYVKPDGNNGDTGLSWDLAYLTITQACSVASSGDSIWIEEGLYQELEITIPEGVSFTGSFPNTDIEDEHNTYDDTDVVNTPTIIDGQHAHRCVINGNSISSCQIINGNCTGPGGGIYNNHYGVVSNCILYNNHADGKGGAIYNAGINSTSKCKLHNNTSDDDGGAIYNQYQGTVENCIIYGNSCDSQGGGVYMKDADTVHCTIYNNHAGTDGGGSYRQHISGQSRMINCIVWGNSERIGDTSDVHNTGYIYNTCCSEGVALGNGCIAQDPVFRSIAANDFHLQEGSPCIDTGLYSGTCPTDDFDGNSRPQDNDGDSINEYDMGAYEGFVTGISSKNWRLY